MSHTITLTPEQAATLMQALAQVEAVLKDLPLAPVQCEMALTGAKRDDLATPTPDVEERAPMSEIRHHRFRQRLQRHRRQHLQAPAPSNPREHASCEESAREIPASFHV